MPQVTAHITVVAQGSPPPNPATGSVAAQAGQEVSPEQGFARMLAAHIVQAPEKRSLDALKPALSDETQALPDNVPGQQVADAATALALPQFLHHFMPTTDRASASADKEGRVARTDLPLELQSLVKAQAKQEPTLFVPASTVDAKLANGDAKAAILDAKAANVDTEAAKFAGLHRALQEGQAKVGDETTAATNLVAATVIEHRAPAQLQGSEQVRVEVPVGAKGWDQAVGQRLVWLANNNQQTAQLHVTPPNLGPVEIRLTISNDQASAVFVSPHASVREALESALPRLREMFADSGLTLANANVASEQQHQRSQEGANQGRRRGGHGHQAEEAGIEGVEGVNGLRRGVASIRTGPDGLVDIFA